MTGIGITLAVLFSIAVIRTVNNWIHDHAESMPIVKRPNSGVSSWNRK